jgi:hypothetical protein
VPFFHSQAARHLNCAAAGALVRASRAAIKAATFTPLLTPLVGSAIVPSIGSSERFLFQHSIEGAFKPVNLYSQRELAPSKPAREIPPSYHDLRELAFVVRSAGGN